MQKSSSINFSQIAVTAEVQLEQNFDFLRNLLIGTSGQGKFFGFLKDPIYLTLKINPFLSHDDSQCIRLSSHCPYKRLQLPSQAR